jgi:hypothetical protein
MRLTFNFVLLALLVAVPARATILISPGTITSSSTMPGQLTDFTFFGNPLQFPAGVGSVTHNYTSGIAMQPSLLTDFIPVVGSNATATYGAQNNTGGVNFNPAYGSITDPAGTLEKTGIIYGAAAPSGVTTDPDLVSFILGPNTGTFNFADFDVYVMVSNAPGAGLSDTELLASVEDATGAVGLTPTVGFSITDNTTTVGTATFADFHITGASSGDVLELGAVATPGTTPYLSGVSFRSNTTAAPEPSTNALMLGGLAMLGLLFRRGRTLASNA